ncbi:MULTISPECIES: hypothetical protein [unclassified Microcella]|uniref:hypothetical protein n=1 Tax=unclassified Microcella TaxID=2630066 RepID=UPI0006FDAF20|nr:MULTISPECIES: hypothetical protein [unclassified Microcella]KQV24551.1 hypothetical protein ASC54_08420 [Yonghaparkia sp. Root332]
MTPDRLRSAARLLLTLAAIGAVLVIGAQLVAPPLAVTAPVRVAIDGVRFVGPPLALLLGVLALLRARALERRARTGSTPPDRERADAIVRGLIAVALLLMGLGVLSAIWSSLVLRLGGLLP